MLACLLSPALSETRLDAALRVARSRVHASSIHSTSGGAVSPLSNASGRLRPADQMEGNTGDVKGQTARPSQNTIPPSRRAFHAG